MADVTTSTVIAAPRGVVAEYATDPDHAPEWYENITSIEWETEPPLRIGSRMRFVARFLGRTMRYTYEVVEFEPGRRLVMRTTDGPAMETTYEWTDRADGTTNMTLRNRGGMSGVGRIFDPLMGAAMRRANEKDLRTLKGILEASG